jgi:RNA polymerase primary sigma factor
MRLPVRKIVAIRRAMKAFHAPGHAPINDRGDSVDFGEVLPDTRSHSPETALTRSEDFAQVLRLLDGMNERDARIVRLRYGLEGQSPRTLKEIGAEIGLTRERVRQIEVETLQRLAERLSEEDERAAARANGVGRKAG